MSRRTSNALNSYIFDKTVRHIFLARGCQNDFIHNSSRMLEGDGNKTPLRLSAINAVPRKSHSFWEASMKVYIVYIVLY